MKTLTRVVPIRGHAPGHDLHAGILVDLLLLLAVDRPDDQQRDLAVGALRLAGARACGIERDDLAGQPDVGPQRLHHRRVTALVGAT